MQGVTQVPGARRQFWATDPTSEELPEAWGLELGDTVPGWGWGCPPAAARASDGAEPFLALMHAPHSLRVPRPSV